MSSTKPEVHNVSQRRRRRTEPSPSATCKQFGKDRACGSGDILSDRQTDRQTDRYTETYTNVLITILSHPLRRQSKKLALLLLIWIVYFVIG